MVKLAFFYTKGGTGKTTICFNYGWYLAEIKEKRVLFLDFDPQMNLVKSFGKIPDKAYEMTLEKMVVEGLKKSPINLSDYLFRIHPRIDLLPSSNNMSQLEEYLTDYLLQKSDRENLQYRALHRNILIKQLLDEQIRKSNYDFVLIDSLPNYSLLSTTAIIYAQRLVLIVQPELYSLLDMNYLFKIVDSLNEKFDIEIRPVGVLINKYEAKKSISRRISKEFDVRFGDKVPILRQRIRNSPFFQLSVVMERSPVFLSYPKSAATADALAAFAELDGLVEQAEGKAYIQPRLI
jgi:chromosome partitioning protein